MRGLAVLTVAFVFASTALFVGPASAQSGSASLQGTVCTTAGSQPMPLASGPSSACQYQTALPGATVKLTRAGTLPTGPSPIGPTEATATTDANGVYRFSGLQSGDYQMLVTRTGFEDVTGTVSVAAGSVQDVAMTGKPIEAKGRVTDGEGAPVADAQLQFCCGEEGSASAATGADGRYAASVRAGRWTVSVQAPGFQGTSRDLFLDGAAENDLALQRVPPQDAKVTGVVRDQDGAPVSGARVALSNYGGCCYASEGATSASPDSSSEPRASSMPYPAPYYGENYTFTDAEGRYTIGAYAGDNGLSASKDGYAYASRTVTVTAGQSTTQDLTLMKYPEKTARITGRIVDDATGKAVAAAYLNVQSPQYGLYECSQRAGGSGGGTSGSAGSTEPASDKAIAPGEPYGEPYAGCAITVQDDGTFEGLVTPGYAILSVWADWSSTCASVDERGVPQDCGPEYYSWTLSRELAPDATTRIDVRLRARPAPDAEVSGYVVDAKTGEAIPGAQLSFSNQDSWGWGSAVTDADGSYRLRLRAGYHTVNVWAEGHLGWQGVLDVAKGDNPFDVTVTPGEASWGGGCCYAYATRGGVAMAAEDKAAGSGSGFAGAPQASGDGLDADGSSQAGAQYEDLGGGLGPYNAAERAKLVEDDGNGAPGAGLLAVLAALGAVLVLRRRR